MQSTNLQNLLSLSLLITLGNVAGFLLHSFAAKLAVSNGSYGNSLKSDLENDMKNTSFMHE